MVLYTSSNLIDPIYPVGNLLANTTYNFTVTPFVSDTPELNESIQVTTLAVIGSLDVNNVTETSVLLQWDRLAYAYNRINVTWTNINLLQSYYQQTNNINNVYVTGEIKNAQGTSNLITNLIPNNPYYFTIDAFNSAGVATPPLISDTIVTLATVGPITCDRNNTTTHTMTLTWGRETYSHVNIYWLPTTLDGATGSPLSLNDASNVATNPRAFSVSNIIQPKYTLTNLTSNVVYNVSIVPYNSKGVPSRRPSSIQWTTVPVVNNTWVTRITNNSVRVNWDPNGTNNASYYSITVRVLRNDDMDIEIFNPVNYQSQLFNLDQNITLIRNSYVDVYNLLPDTRYHFQVIPCVKDIPAYPIDFHGLSIFTRSIQTLATVGGPLTATNITNHGFTLNWKPGVYTSLNLSYQSSNNIQTSNIYNIQSNVNKINILSLPIDGLYGNMEYNVQLYPMNSNNVANYSSNIIVTTLPNIPLFGLYSIDQYAITSNSIHLSWNSDNIYQSYSYVDILWNTCNIIDYSRNTNSLTNLQRDNIIIPNLLINQLYNFTLVTYNKNHVRGSNLYFSTTTYGTIKNLQASASNITTNSVSFAWSNYNSGLNIAYYPQNNPSAIQNIQFSSNLLYTQGNVLPATTTITNLSPDVNYIFNFYSSNSQNVATNNPATIQVRTLPNVNQLYINNVLSNSINISWDQQSAFEYINLSWTLIIDKQTQITSTTFLQYSDYPQPNNNYTINNLLANNAYTFAITPYNLPISTSNITNQIGTYGNTVLSQLITYTLSDITTASITDYTTNTLTLLWTYPPNSYYTITVSWYDINDNIVGNVLNVKQNGYTINDGSLLPNQQYSVYISSYNTNSILGKSLYADAFPVTGIHTSNIIMKPNAGTINIATLTTNSIAAVWNPVSYYAYINVNLYDQYNNLTSNIPNYMNNSYTFNNLISNGTYLIDLIPYNCDTPAVVGPHSQIYIATLATVGAITISDLTDTSFTVNWGPGTYTSVTLQYQQYDANSATVYPVNTIYSYATSSNINNLISNETYNISVYPNNSQYLPSQPPLGTPSVYTIVTYATLLYASVTNFTTTTADISWYGGTYNSIQIQWTDRYHTTLNPNAVRPPSDFNSTTINNLYPNTSYTFQVMPENIAQVPSAYNSIHTTPIVTAATITNIQTSNIRSSAVSLVLNNGVQSDEYQTYSLSLYNYNSTRILFTDTNQNTPIYTIDNSIIGRTIISPNTTYTLTFVPYNLINVANLTYNNPISFTSLATIGTIQAPVLSTTSIRLIWDKANSSYSIINWSPLSTDGSYVSPQITNGTYTIPNLLPNSQYSINIYPYNSIGASNYINYSTITKYTLPLITDSSINNITATALTVNWSGYFSNVQLTVLYQLTNTVVTSLYTNANSYSVGSLNPDKLYNVQVIPYNNDAVAGTAMTSNVYTLPIIYTFIYIPNRVTTNSIYVNWNSLQNVATGGVGITWNPPDSLPSGQNIITNITKDYTITGLNPNVYYTIQATPYNSATPKAAGSPLYIQVLTNAQIKSAVATLGTSSANSYVVGGYSNLLITWQNISVPNSPTLSNYFINYNNSPTTYTTYNIQPETLYTFTYIPYDNSNVQGVPFTIPSVSSAATVEQINVTTYTANTISVDWSGNTGANDYNYVSIYYNGVYSPYQYGTSYQITGLLPNTYYTIKAIPYNYSGTSNISAATSTSITTLPLISTAYASPLNIFAYNLSLDVVGTYCNATISYVSAGKASNINIIGPYVNADVLVPINGLLPNTTYTFAISSYNNSNYAGVIYNANVTTKSIIDSISITSITTNTFTVGWITDSTYDNLLLKYSYTNTLTGVNTIAPSPYIYTNPTVVGPVVATSPQVNITPNTIYRINLQPTVGVGQYINFGIPSPTVIVNTLPTIGNTITATNIKNNSVSIVLSSANRAYFTYANMYIYNNFDNSLVSSYSNILQLPSTSLSQSIQSLNAKTTYNVVVYPYNQSNIVGAPVSNTFTTLTIINNDATTYVAMTADTSPPAANTYTSTATIHWSGIYDSIKYYYYNYTGHPAPPTNPTRTTVNSAQSPNSAVVQSGLLPNTQYAFVIEPYSSASVVGVSNVLYQYTLPSIMSASAISYTDTSVSLIWSSGGQYDKYDSITITATPSLPVSLSELNIQPPPTSQTPYLISGLMANTSYTFNIIPNNSDSPSAAGNQINVPVVTYADLTSSSVIPNVSSIDNITFNGGYNYVNIQYTYNSAQHTINSAGQNSSITGLTANTAINIVFIPYNSANIAYTGNTQSPYVISTYTLATVTGINKTASTQSITLSWTKSGNSYNYLVISWQPQSGSDPSAVSGTSQNILYTASDNAQYQITSLVAYTVYTITVTAYNNAIVPVPNVVSTFDYSTLVFISQIYATTVLSSSITVEWIGQYSSVHVSYVGSTPVILSGMTTMTYTFIGLNPNTTYTFTAVPYDSVNNVGTTATVTVVTLPTVNSTINITNIGYNSVRLDWSSGARNIYSYVSIQINPIDGSGVGNTIVTNPITNITAQTYTVTGLSPNTTYNFTITPYNTTNTPGTSVTSSSILTLGLISNLQVTRTTVNNIYLQWDPNQFYTVNIQVAVNNSVIQYINNYIGGNTYDFGGYLTPCTAYSMSVYAVNSAGTVNNTQNQIANPNTVITSTMPQINTFAVNSATSNAISVAWSGYVSGVTLQWVGDDSTSGQIGSSANFASLYTSSNYNTYNTGSLSINTAYTFRLTPYNTLMAVGGIKTITGTTLATIGTVTIDTPTISSVNLSWSSGKYTYVIVSWSGTSSGRSQPVYSSPYALLGLLPNGLYQIIITPYNKDSNPAPGSPFIISNVYTLPIIDSFNIINVTATNLTITWSGLYSSLNIAWSGLNNNNGLMSTGTLNNIQGTSYDFANHLSPNTTYTFTVTPYNGNGTPNPYVPVNPDSLSTTTSFG